MTSFKLTSSVTILAFACASACASPAAHAAPPQSAMGHGGARSAATNVEASNKVIIKELSLALLGGADLQALGRYFAPNLIAHDPVMSNGRGGMLVAIDALRRSLPGHTLTIKHILADRDQVLVHSHISSTPANEKSGLNRIDIYRLDRGIVVEHWDVRNAAPTSSASGNSAFSDLYQYAGPKPVLSDERVEGNRLLVKHVSEEVFGKQNFALLDRLFGVNYIQHNPYVGNGRAALASVIQYISSPNRPYRIFQSLADDDISAVCAHVVDPIAKASDEFAGAVVCDLFRVANFELVEHWDLGQAIPSTSASGNSMVSRLYQGNQGQQ